jgi:hypothetical protein
MRHPAIKRFGVYTSLSSGAPLYEANCLRPWGVCRSSRERVGVGGVSRKEQGLKTARLLEAKKLLIHLLRVSNSKVEDLVALLSLPLNSDTRKKEHEEYDGKEQWTSLSLLNPVTKTCGESKPSETVCP